jgi:hypothetical protein
MQNVYDPALKKGGSGREVRGYDNLRAAGPLAFLKPGRVTCKHLICQELNPPFSFMIISPDYRGPTPFRTIPARMAK